MKENIYAHTAPAGSYPEYVSVNARGGKIEIVVRSEQASDGGPGAVAEIRLSEEQAREMTAALFAALGGTIGKDSAAQIDHMVDRFLNWKLPENFNPDGGISFQKTTNENTPWPHKSEPVGTNLFDAQQAKAMVLHMIEGLPAR
ncbi:MAG: hypothetical protein KF895_02860 [Parvibaculum sp.]|nr:hypothetical protein [Parvibaculum sp.]